MKTLGLIFGVFFQKMCYIPTLSTLCFGTITDNTLKISLTQEPTIVHFLTLCPCCDLSLYQNLEWVRGWLIKAISFLGFLIYDCYQIWVVWMNCLASCILKWISNLSPLNSFNLSSSPCQLPRPKYPGVKLWCSLLSHLTYNLSENPVDSIFRIYP